MSTTKNKNAGKNADFGDMDASLFDEAFASDASEEASFDDLAFWDESGSAADAASGAEASSAAEGAPAESAASAAASQPAETKREVPVSHEPNGEHVRHESHEAQEAKEAHQASEAAALSSGADVASLASSPAAAPEAFDVKTAALCGPTLLEASAGTGKTFSIKHIVLRIVAELGIPVESLLVVTFTRAATAELKSRIQKHLADMQGLLTGQLPASEADPLLIEQLALWRAAVNEDGSRRWSDEQLMRRIRGSLMNFDDAGIYTIHSFCQKALTGHAFSSSSALEADFGADDSRFLEETAEDFIRREIDANPDEDFRRLLIRGSGWTQKLSELCKFPESLVARQIDLSSVLDEGASPELVQAIGEMLTRFCREAPEDVRRRKAEAGKFTFDDILTDFWRRLESDRTGAFAESLRREYRGVLIDEFQDTDPVQFAIFDRLFLSGLPAGACAARPLFFVGDPKQAIYRFRSADLDTYFKARSIVKAGRRDATGAWTGRLRALMKNFRSSPDLVAGFNAFFGASPHPFVREALAYTKIAADEGKTGIFVKNSSASVGGDSAPAWREAPALEVWTSRPGVGFANVGDMREAAAEAVANDIARLLAAGAAGEAAVAAEGDEKASAPFEAEVRGKLVKLRPIEARDIAILVRKRDEAEPLKAALAKRRIRVRMKSQESVLATPEARELRLILEAVTAPDDERALKAARTTRILGETLSSLANETEARRIEVRSLFEAAAADWRRLGVAAALQKLFDEADAAPRLLKIRGGERILTNYSHLIEILHRAGRTMPVPAGLLSWYAAETAANPAPDDENGYAVRLESDANLVRIETIHSSKGLQYPAVYIPAASDTFSSRRPTNAVSRIHPAPGAPLSLVIRHLKGAAEDAYIEEEKEEALRLAYVAMTRAAKRLVICLPQTQNKSGGWKSATLVNAYFAILAGTLKPSASEAEAGLAALSAAGIPILDIEAQASAYAALPPASAGAAEGLSAAPAVRRRAVWRQSSFSAIAAMQEDDAGPKAPFFGTPRAEAKTVPPTDILAFPAGTRAGTCLHSLFEHADFARMAGSDNAAQDARMALCRRIIAKHLAFRDEASLVHASVAASDMMRAVLNTELAPGVRLKDVPKSARFAEMEFLLTLRAPSVTAQSLGAFLGQLDPKYGFSGMKNESLAGYLTGFIDLAMYAGGKFWVLDWKSNAISKTDASAYTQAAMAAEMEKHHYRLQYLLYLVALRRFLKERLGAAFREDLIGGAIYVFLRGVREGAPGQGVVLDRVHPAVIRALDDLFEKNASNQRCIDAAKAEISAASAASRTAEEEALQ